MTDGQAITLHKHV